MRSVSLDSRGHVRVRERTLRGSSNVVLLAGTVHVHAKLVDEAVEVDGRATLDIQVHTGGRSDSNSQPGLYSHSPVEDGIAKRTCRAASTEEYVPDGVSELLCLRRRREACGTGRATKTDSDDLALRLAGLDGGREEGAIRKL